MRRTWVRGHAKILKRYLVHFAAFNLGLLMRSLLGAGTPKGLAEQLRGLRRGLGCLIDRLAADLALLDRILRLVDAAAETAARAAKAGQDALQPAGARGFSTGC
jgi:hypothetical protein